jgi:hypothetical protein
VVGSTLVAPIPPPTFDERSRRLESLGRVEEGRDQLRLAASMTRNERERTALLAKAAAPPAALG